MDDQQLQFEIRFEGLTADEAGLKAKKLRQELLAVSPEVSVAVVKDDHTNQDFGSTLVLTLGTPAVIAVAHGIAAYLKRDRARIGITKDGVVFAENISGEDAAKIAQAVAKIAQAVSSRGKKR
jgi:hypothetical protein